VAESMNGLALRNCVNASLPAMSCPGVAALFEDGDEARVDFTQGRIENLTRNTSMDVPPLAPLLAEIVAAGGVVPMLLREGYVHPEPFVAASS
jgi:3-isopropylmalate/(R)-2-methylmalate dehydratase small subunit